METVLVDTDTQINYPLLGDRVQSAFIDGMLIIVLMFICSSVLENYEHAPDWLRVGLFVGIWAVYEPVCTSLGCTLGNYVKWIRIRNYNDSSKRINIFQAIIRYIVKTLLGWISFLTINTNKEKRAIHDFAAGSIVIFIKK